MELPPAELSIDHHGAVIQVPGKPWGLWITLLFSALITLIHTVVSLVAVGSMIGLTAGPKPPGNIDAQLSSLMFNGFYVAVATVAGAIVTSGLIIFLAAMRRGMALSDYLGFKRVTVSALVRWIVLVGLVLALADLTSWLVGRPIVPQFMVQAYATAGFRPLFFFAIVIAAPLVEELFFRGFLFAGLASSRLGVRWAVALTAVAWGAIHTQYELYDIALICLLGLIFAIARWQTASIYTSMVLHAVTNLGALVEVWLLTPVGR